MLVRSQIVQRVQLISTWDFSARENTRRPYLAMPPMLLKMQIILDKKTTTVDRDSVLKVDLAPGGGNLIILDKIKN